MAVVIGQIVTETAADPRPADSHAESAGLVDDQLETVVRRATDRVLETLRREWDR